MICELCDEHSVRHDFRCRKSKVFACGATLHELIPHSPSYTHTKSACRLAFCDSHHETLKTKRITRTICPKTTVTTTSIGSVRKICDKLTFLTSHSKPNSNISPEASADLPPRLGLRAVAPVVVVMSSEQFYTI